MSITVSNRAKFPVDSHSGEQADFWIRLTAAGSDAVPTLTVNGGGIVASVAHNSTGNWTVTLHPRFVYLMCTVNVAGTAYTGAAVCVDGNSAANSITVQVRAIGGNVANPNNEVVDLHCVGIRRKEGV